MVKDDSVDHMPGACVVSREDWGSGGTPDFDWYFRKVIVSSCGCEWGRDLAGLEGELWKL